MLFEQLFISTLSSMLLLPLFIYLFIFAEWLWSVMKLSVQMIQMCVMICAPENDLNVFIGSLTHCLLHHRSWEAVDSRTEQMQLLEPGNGCFPGHLIPEMLCHKQKSYWDYTGILWLAVRACKVFSASPNMLRNGFICLFCNNVNKIILHSRAAMSYYTHLVVLFPMLYMVVVFFLFFVVCFFIQLYLS